MKFKKFFVLFGFFAGIAGALYYAYRTAEGDIENPAVQSLESEGKKLLNKAKSGVEHAEDSLDEGVEKLEKKVSPKAEKAPSKPIYKWQDDEGVWHYSSDFFSIPKRFQKRAKPVKGGNIIIKQ